MKKIVYIAGPMTGIPELNFPAFNEAAKRWSEAGWLVLNPASHLGGATDGEYSQYMRVSFHDLLVADAIALLPGAEASAGASAEIIVAERLGLPFFDAETMDELDPPVSGLTVRKVQILERERKALLLSLSGR